MSIAMMAADYQRAQGERVEERPIRLVSIGTGGSPVFDRIDDAESNESTFSMVDWFLQASYIAMTIPQMHATFESSGLADNYLRVDLHSPSAMDDAEAVDDLIL